MIGRQQPEAIIQAIETHYRGYRFRSRLEARWAVFFTTAGVSFQYEHQGFRLPKGGLYLPDFFLPAFTAYLEVKPLPSPLTSIGEQQKIYNSWNDESEDFPVESIFPRLPDPLPREVRLGCELVALSSREISFVVVYGDPLDVLEDNNSIGVDWKNGVYAGSAVGFLDHIVPLYKAADVARQARFEHGETP